MNFLLAHLSDAHIGPLPRPQFRELMGKRLTGYINWKRRRGIHNMDVLDRIVADMRAQSPDHVAMTGDIINIGLPGEFTAARAWMQTLGRPQDVSFVPGNHDAYVRGSLAQIMSGFAPWSSHDGESHTAFPYLRVRENIALIGVSSAIVTAPFLASGALGAQQRQALGGILARTREQGLMRIVMIHHPPWRSGATPGPGLRDARAFEALIAREGAELIIHGHNHRMVRHDMVWGERRVPVIGVASASAVPGTPRHLAAYHLYAIERSGDGWMLHTRVRGIQADAADIADIADFKVAIAR